VARCTLGRVNVPSSCACDTFPPAALPPGALAAFGVTIYGPPASQIASVQASVEPELE